MNLIGLRYFSRFRVFGLGAAALMGSCLLGSPNNPALRILAIADIQYSQDEPRLGRHYKNSLQKLEQIKKATAGQPVDLLVNLGDSVDKRHKNLAPVLARLSGFKMPRYHVLGNHDFADTPDNVRMFVKDLNLDSGTYYTVEKDRWLLVFLDTNTLGSYYNIGGAELKKEAEAALAKAQENNAKNAKRWNGGIDKKQLAWLDAQLKDAQSRRKNVVVFAHSPLLPVNSHSALNTDEILEVLFKYPCLKSYIAGHNHKGSYQNKNGIHFLTLSGLVEGESDVSYAVLDLHEDKIIVQGHGRAKSHVFEFTASAP